jgi:predicted permease
MEDNNSGAGVRIAGLPETHGGSSWVRASAEYFDSVGTRVLLGRAFTENDTASAPMVAIVNQTFVNDFIPKGTNPIGQHFGTGSKSTLDYEIVGVVDDTAYSAAQWKDHTMYFTPMLQRPASWKDPIATDTSLYAGDIVVQTAHPMPDMESIARETLAGINPNLAVVKFQTFDQQIADRFTEERMVARLTTLFGALALLLATIGLYGVTAWTVARQTSEIGIRMALGAERLRVIAMVMRGAMIQTVLGLAIGIPAALFCVRYVEAQLYEIKGVSPVILSIAIATLVLAAFFAGLIPARRAASIDPAVALRTE